MGFTRSHDHTIPYPQCRGNALAADHTPHHIKGQEYTHTMLKSRKPRTSRVVKLAEHRVGCIEVHTQSHTIMDPSVTVHDIGVYNDGELIYEITLFADNNQPIKVTQDHGIGYNASLRLFSDYKAAD